MIRRIIFDLGDVLIDINARKAFGELNRLCQADKTGVFNFFLSPTHLNFMSGTVSPEEFYHIFAQKYRFSLDMPAFWEIWNHVLGPVKKGIIQLLNQLKAKGYILLLCSNTDPVHFRYVAEKYEILQKFQRFYLSFQIGYNKPDPKIFRKILEQEAVSASDCLFIDDSADNIQVARGLGFNAIQMISVEQLEKELERMKIV